MLTSKGGEGSLRRAGVGVRVDGGKKEEEQMKTSRLATSLSLV